MTPILLDCIIGIVILLSLVHAFFRGFVREVLTLVNVFGSGAAAWFFGPQLVPPFERWLGVDMVEKGKKAEAIWGLIPPEVMAHFLAYGAVFFGVFIILALAGMAIASSIAALGLGPVDKTLGMAFGAARGFLLVFLVYLPFGFFMQPKDLPKWAQDSVSVHVLDATYNWMDEYLKDDEEKEGDAEKEKPVDPNSAMGKLKKMGDDIMLEKYEQPKEYFGEESPYTPRHTEQDLLTDDEMQYTP